MATFTPIELDENGEEICGCICHKYPPHTVMHCVPCCPEPKRDPAVIVYTFPNGGNIYDDDDTQ